MDNLASTDTRLSSLKAGEKQLEEGQKQVEDASATLQMAVEDDREDTMQRN